MFLSAIDLMKPNLPVQLRICLAKLLRSRDAGPWHARWPTLWISLEHTLMCDVLEGYLRSSRRPLELAFELCFRVPSPIFADDQGLDLLDNQEELLNEHLLIFCRVTRTIGVVILNQGTA